jgi:hypothetical protein
VRPKLLVISAASLVLGVGAMTASASRGLGLSSSPPVVITFPALTFNSPEFEAPIVCEISKSITIHRTIAKVNGTLFGMVTSVSVRNCRGGQVRVLAETLPWHMSYVSFSGTLPNISTIRLQLNGVAYLISEGFLFNCLYRGNPQGITGGGTFITRFSYDESIHLPLNRRLSGICPANIILGGSATVSPSVAVGLA